jgi:hypothetical protein
MGKSKSRTYVRLLLFNYFILLFPFPPVFFASNSLFASKRFGDLYGRLEVFFFGLNAIIRVIAVVYINFGK